MRFNDMNKERQLLAVFTNRDYFVKRYGVPEGGQEKHYRSSEFMFNLFQRNNFEFDEYLGVIDK